MKSMNLSGRLYVPRPMQVRLKVTRLVKRPGDPAWPNRRRLRLQRCASGADPMRLGRIGCISARITGDRVRTTIVETVAASPAIFVVSALGYRLSIATASVCSRFIPTSNR